jgi:hypothetical protein
MDNTTTTTKNKNIIVTNTHWASGWNNVNWLLYAKLRYQRPNPLGVNINIDHLATVLKVRHELDKEQQQY